MVEILKQLESELGDKAFFGGESFGFLDVALVSYTIWFHTYQTCGGFSIGDRLCVGISLADQTKVYDFALALKKVFE